MSFDICPVFLEPTDPSLHGGGTGIVFISQRVLGDLSIQYIFNNLCIIVFMRHQAVREFRMEPSTPLTEKPADLDVFLFFTAKPTDPFAGVPIAKRFSATGADPGDGRGLYQKHPILPCTPVRNLLR